LSLHHALLSAVPDDPVKALKFLHNEHVSGLLQSSANLGTDMLLHRLKYFALRTNPDDHLFHCENCGYGHIGFKHCPRVDPFESMPRLRPRPPPRPNQVMRCPQCDDPHRTFGLSFRVGRRTTLKMTYPCTSCDGAHTKKPVVEN
jgi:hypothetical protein